MGGVSRRNAFSGVITKVTRDKVPRPSSRSRRAHIGSCHLITREAADELGPRAGDGGRCHREGDERDGGGAPVKPRGALVIAVMLVANACGSEEPATPDAITVFAAASLTEAFTPDRDRLRGSARDPRSGSASDLPTDSRPRSKRERPPTCSPRRARNGWMPSRKTRAWWTARTSRATSSIVITPAENPGRCAFRSVTLSPGIKLVLAAEGVPVGDYACELLNQRGDRRRGAGQRGLQRG